MDEERIEVQSCRSCSDRYIFNIDPGTSVSVLCGRPGNNIDYKAISYLWESTKPLLLKCRNCPCTKVVPMRDAAKLLSILRFVRSGQIWLDALSIDQDDDHDLTSQLAVMGDIYRQAKTVSVLLPEQDRGAYEALKELAIIADQIVRLRHEYGICDADEPSSAEDAYQQPELAHLAETYMKLVTKWDRDITKWKYWTRAWTF